MKPSTSLLILAALQIPLTAKALGPECDDPKEGSTLQESCLLQSIRQKMDAQLNEIYRDLLSIWNTKESSAERNGLIAAQRAWLSYRDKTCSFEQTVNGGIVSISWSRCMARLTEERVAYLKELRN